MFGFGQHDETAKLLPKGYFGNVYFLAVARIEKGRGIVMASHSYNSEIDINGVKKVIEQPNISITPSKHYGFSVGQSAWHLIADESEIHYILISKLSYPQRCAYMCLQELQRTFGAKVGEEARTANDHGLDSTCKSLLQLICQKYDNVADVDSLASVTQKIDSVKLQMQENIDLALQNCVKLESIEKTTEDVQQQAGIFKRNALTLKHRMWCENMKVWLILGLVVLALLALVVGLAVFYAQQAKDASKTS